MFTLYAKVIGHSLSWVDTPALAEGSVRADQIHFDFDSTWDGFAKVALFWRTENDNPIGVTLTSQNCAVIPYEVLAQKATVRVGVYGTASGNSRITTTVLAYSVDKGAWSENIANAGSPTASLLEQFQNAANTAISRAAELLDGVRDKGTLYFQELATGKNLFNAYSAANTDGSYLSSAGAVLTGSSYSGLSHYIPVKAGVTYYIETGTTESSSRYCAFYDEYLNFISSQNAQANPVVTAPSGAVAMRFVYRTATRYTAVQVEEGDVATPYEPFIADKPNFDLASEAAMIHGETNYEVRGEPNLFNAYSRDNLSGYYLNAGVLTESSSYGVSHHIPVTPGRHYLFGCGATVNASRQTVSNACRWAFYDQYGTLLLGKSGWGAQAPERAVSLRISYLLSAISEVVVEEYAPQTANLFNAYSRLNEDCVYVRRSGSGFLYNSNDRWSMSHYIPVTGGATYSFCFTGTSTAPRVLVFDGDFGYISELFDDDSRSVGAWWTLAMPANAAWIRIPYDFARRYSMTVLAAGSNAPSSYVAYRGATVGLGERFMAYLPDRIYCAVGRTIDIYNAQVCLNPEWYHIRWICDTGYAFARKFSVTGTAPDQAHNITGNVGEHALTLHIYDKSGRMLYNKTATLVVTNGLSSNQSMLMIGDSLTKHDKPVLAELVSLSSGRITPVGRQHGAARDSGGTTRDCYCESISGKSPLWFLTNTASPFYDSSTSKFGWGYYKHHEGAADVNPGFVCIFLGTNGLGENPRRQAAYIAQIVSRIREEDSSIKILVCHPIYRSNQDGIAVQTGSDGYSSGTIGAFKRIEDEKIMGLMIELDRALAGMARVYTVSVAVSMDAAFNFGINEAPVNPRNTDYVEFRPTESIHPQACGYYQIADIIYSAVSAVV